MLFSVLPVANIEIGEIDVVAALLRKLERDAAVWYQLREYISRLLCQSLPVRTTSQPR